MFSLLFFCEIISIFKRGHHNSPLAYIIELIFPPFKFVLPSKSYNIFDLLSRLLRALCLIDISQIKPFFDWHPLDLSFQWHPLRLSNKTGPSIYRNNIQTISLKFTCSPPKIRIYSRWEMEEWSSYMNLKSNYVSQSKNNPSYSSIFKLYYIYIRM